MGTSSLRIAFRRADPSAQRFRDFEVRAPMRYLEPRVMDPKPPPPPSFSDLPDLFASDSGSSAPTNVRNLQNQARSRTLPSVQPKAGEGSPDPYRGSSAPVAVVPVQQITVPSGQIAQGFRASPAMAALGGEILDWSPPRLIRVRYPVLEGWMNLYGSLSGGFLSAMFEPAIAAMAYAVAPSRQHAVLEMSARFFRQLRDGHVVVDALLVRAGTTTGTVDCLAWDPRGELCAKASATLLFVG